jgi:hypothetical protein
MKNMKLLILGLFATAAVAVVPTANAQPAVHFLASGGTSAFQQFGVSVVNDIAAATPTFTGGGSIHHFTIKGTCADSIEPGTPCVGVVDGRNHAIPVESASYWLVWVCPAAGCTGANATDVWAYDSLDATVALRNYLASSTSVVATGTQTGVDPAGNLIKAQLFLYGDATGACGGPTTCDAAEIPADVYAAVNGAVFNASTSDIRPEDALFATERANSVSTLSPWSGLGYGGGPTTLIGASIASAFTQTFATPVAFGLPGGTDPFTGNPIPATIKVFTVGEEPIVFVVNRTDANGLGNVVAGEPWYNNVVDNAGTGPLAYAPSPIGQLFGGVNCSGSSNAIGNFAGGVFTSGLPTGLANFGVNPILREALSAAENVVEYNAFRTYGGSLGGAVGGSEVSNANVVVTTSQESYLVATAGNAPVNPLGGPQATNPPGTPCTNFGGSGLGSRYRAISTSEEVGNPTKSPTGVALKADSIGYTFFSFGNISNLANNPNYGYVTLDGVDPIFNSYAGGDPGQPATGGAEQGELPACTPADNGTQGKGCLRTDVWTAGNSFPHLRDGSYRAWALLRALCDTATAHCLVGSDSFGTEAIVRAAQDDIHNSTVAVADFLPFSDDGSFGPAGGFGDVSFVRSHYAFSSSVGAGGNTYPSTHITPSFSILPVGLNANQANGTGGDPEAGGDAGGCIIPAQVPQVLAVTGAFGTNPQTSGGTNYEKMKLNYSALAPGQVALTGVCGPGSGAGFTGQPCTSSFLNAENSGATIAPTHGVNCGNTVGTCNAPASGLSLAVTGFAAADNDDNGVFQVTRILYDGQIKVRVEPVQTGFVKTVTAAAQATANTGCVQ